MQHCLPCKIMVPFHHSAHVPTVITSGTYPQHNISCTEAYCRLELCSIQLQNCLSETWGFLANFQNSYDTCKPPKSTPCRESYLLRRTCSRKAGFRGDSVNSYLTGLSFFVQNQRLVSSASAESATQNKSNTVACLPVSNSRKLFHVFLLKS